MMANGIILALFFVSLFFIVWNKIPRSIVAIFGALVLVFMGEYFHIFSQAEALRSIDFNTIGLLMGMMILVTIIKQTGFLTFIAIKSAKASRGNLFLLMIILGVVTALLSMLLDNVTTLVIIGPATILIADLLGVSAIPFLITEVVFSNIGGVGTLIGDPPNIMIASVSGFTFNDFLMNTFPIVCLVLIILAGVTAFLFRKDLRSARDNFDSVLNMDESKAIKGKRGVKRALGCLVFVIFMFTMHSVFPFEPAFIALFGASLALLLVQPDPDEIFREIEWDVLFFFAALFVIVEAANQTGIFALIAEGVTDLGSQNFLLCSTLLMWIASICSMFIGSIAFTAAAIPVIQNVPLEPDQVNALWWSLALGVGFGGNGLPISSAAGVLCLAIMKKADRPLSIRTWITTATVLMVISLVIATATLFLKSNLFS
jgi:Na+/H+ antiporter NhaD/arsenite permease-like protein